MGNRNSYSLFVSQSSEEINNIYISESSTCQSSCNLTFNNNDIIVSGSSGNITIANVCYADASCIISQHAKTKLINTIVQKSSQSVKMGGPDSAASLLVGADLKDLLPGGGSSVQEGSVQSATVANTISQSLSASCTGHTNVNEDSNLVVIKDFTGNVNLTNKGKASANCNMSNTASLSVQNSIAQAASQTAKKIGIFTVIIVAICVIGAVIAAISIAGKHKHNRSKAGQKDSAADLQSDQDASRDQTSGTVEETSEHEHRHKHKHKSIFGHSHHKSRGSIFGHSHHHGFSLFGRRRR